jgi:predicted alpha/beta-fold hydrolase
VINSNQPFIPLALLANAHMMTIMAGIWPRVHRLTSGKKRFFQVKSDAMLLTLSHYAASSNSRTDPTLVIVHGLEGSADSHYVRGLAVKALRAGLHVIRVNLRNCGGTLKLSRTLYNGGLSADIIAIVRELKERDRVKKVFLAGFSLGGNIVLNAAAQLPADLRETVAGVCAVSPAIDLDACVMSMEQGFNRLYEKRFLYGLKNKLKEKHAIFPDLYDLSGLNRIKTLREFDDVYTAPYGGYTSGDHYYYSASAINVIDQISSPTMIIAAKDDPIVPFRLFESEKLNSPHITLLATEHGGHGGFIHKQNYFEEHVGFDRFWAENQVVNFCLGQLAAGVGTLPERKLLIPTAIR